MIVCALLLPIETRNRQDREPRFHEKSLANPDCELFMWSSIKRLFSRCNPDSIKVVRRVIVSVVGVTVVLCFTRAGVRGDPGGARDPRHGLRLGAQVVQKSTPHCERCCLRSGAVGNSQCRVVKPSRRARERCSRMMVGNRLGLIDLIDEMAPRATVLETSLSIMREDRVLRDRCTHCN